MLRESKSENEKTDSGISSNGRMSRKDYDNVFVQ